MSTLKEVTVTNITETKDPNIKRLELRSEIEKPVTTKSQASAILMQGHPKFAPNVEKRVGYQSISSQMIEELNLSVGSELNAAFIKAGKNLKARLQVVETLKPSYEGQKVKINPSTEKVLYKDGNPIYRATELDLKDMDKEFNADVYIQHDIVQAEVNLNTTQEVIREVLV